MSKVEVNEIDKQNGSTLTIGGSGTTVQLGTGASQTGFGRTGTVDWQTGDIKTSDFTAVNTQGFFVDTNGGSITATLPSGSAGAIISFQDYRNTFDTANLTINPASGEKINGGVGAVTLGTEGEGITLVYIDSTVGWRSIQDNDFAAAGSTHVAATGGTESTCGDFKIHTFTGPGTFTVSASGAPTGSDEIEYLVVAGGGGGGFDIAGAGGAGGARFSAPSLAPLTYPAKPLAAPSFPASTGSFPITVGGGGAVTSSGQGCAGSPSIFSSITSTGGGGGGGNGGPAPEKNGAPGGSGGGGGYNGCGASTGGTGNTPPTSPAQGNNGGIEDGYVSGGGGGGMIGAGSNAQGPSCNGGPGGDGGGFPTAFGANGEPCGSYRYYAGGGGGGGRSPSYNPGGTGGKGGAGDGVRSGNGNAGTANTGGGGGGSAGVGPVTAGSAGGSGIVILRYKYQN